jgi:hypothetical protein
MRKQTLAGLWLLVILSGCGSNYAGEVGYYDGESKKWDIWGDFGSLDECRDAAIARYNGLNRESPGRAFSWACLKKSSDGYESRHR